MSGAIMLRMLTAFLLMCTITSALASEQLIKIRILSPALTPSERDLVIASELNGLPGTVVAESPVSALVTTTRAGLDRLNSNPQLQDVRVIDGEASTRQVERKQSIEFDISMERIKPREPVLLNQKTLAAYRAEIKARRKTSSSVAPLRQARRGDIVIEALDSEGAVVERTIVVDPRVVRYERVIGKKLVGRQEFLRDSADLVFSLTDSPQITKVLLKSLDPEGNWQAFADLSL